MDYTGRRIDRYVIRGSLGRGASGMVFRAYDPILQREVALKLLHRNDPKSLARFEREQQACTQLRHPNLAAVHATGATQGLPYIVMELVPGRTLDDLVATSGVPATERAVTIMRDVARAIAYAHGLGILHRDLKPGNILLDEDGAPRVVDFGLASLRESQSLTQTGALLGTPSYMSPEQAAGLHADGQSDVYGLGATLYHLLTGRPPFVENPLMAVHRRDAEPPSLHNPTVSPALDAVCARALARDPDARYPDAEALADDLEAILRGEAEPSASTPTIVWPLAIGAVGLLLGLVGLLAARTPAEPEPAPTPSATAPIPDATSDAPSIATLLKQARERARALAPYPRVRDLLLEAARAAKGDPQREVEVLLAQARLAWRRLQIADADRHLAALTRREGPHRLETAYLAATVLVHRDRFDEARALLARTPVPTTDDDLWPLLVRGLAASIGGKHADSEALTRQALDRDPRNATARLLNGMNLLDLRRVKEAGESLKTLVATDTPDDANAILALLSFERLSRTATPASRARSKALIDRAWSLCGPERSPKLVLACAPVSLEVGDPRATLRFLDHAPRGGPMFPRYQVLRGMAHDRLRQPDAAREAWRTAYRLDPKLIRAALKTMNSSLQFRMRRALQLPGRDGKLGASETSLIAAIMRRAPAADAPTFRRVLELAMLGNPIARLQPGIKALGRRNARITFWLGVILAGRDDLARAVDFLKASLRLGWTEEAALKLALTYLRRGRKFHRPAQGILADLSARTPNTPSGLCARASLLRFQRKPREAIALCNEAIRLQPNHVPSLLLRAHLHADRGPKGMEDGYRLLEQTSRISGFLDAYPASQLAQARLERVGRQADPKPIHAALRFAETIMAAVRSPRLRVLASKVCLNLPAEDEWAVGAWDWLWEATHVPHPQVRGSLPLGKALYLLHRGQAGERINRERVDMLFGRAAGFRQPPPKIALDIYEKVFGSPYRSK